MGLDHPIIGPRVQEFGRKIKNIENGMVLNFTFEDWRPACQQGTKDDWIKDLAVHEFGHAIGFRHEQDRADTPAWCADLSTGPDPEFKLSVWDKESEMNYCWCDGDAQLSELDIASVQSLYGEPGQ